MKVGWISNKLGDVTTKIGSGATPLGGEKAYKETGICLIRSLNVHDWGFKENKLARIDEDQAERLSNVVVEPNDVLLNITGASVARCCLVPPEFLPARVNQHVSIIRPVKEKLLPAFLYYLLISKTYKDRLLHTGEEGGSTRQAITKAQLQQFVIEFPESLAEQQRIVGILDEAFDGIATAKANAEKNLQNARALFESHLQSVFTLRGEGWEEKPLGEVCENLDSKRVPITKNKRTAGEYPYYGASGVVDYVNNYIFDDDLLLVSEDGANLLARTYPIAFSVYGKVWVNNHAHVLKFADLASQRFMEFYLNSIKLDSYVSGMAQPKLNQKSLNSIPVPTLPIRQQKSIVKKLDALSDETQRLESIYKQKITAFDDLKKSMLQQAFTGAL